MLKYIYILTAVILFSFSAKTATALEIAAIEPPSSVKTSEERSQGGAIDIRQAKQRARDIFRAANQIKRTIDRIKARGGAVSSEYESSLNSLMEVTDSFVKTSGDEPNIALMIEEIEKGAEHLNTAIIPGISVITEWQNVAKDAEKEIKSLTRQFERAKKKAGKREDGTGGISLILQSLLNAVNEAFLTAKDLATKGDAESALTLYLQTADKKLEVLSDSLKVFENISNLPLLVKKVDIETARIERKIRNLNASSAEIKELNAAVLNIKSKRSVLGIENQKIEEIFGMLVELEKIQKNIGEKIRSLEERDNGQAGEIQ
ncbi:MAG: hypothetical protein AAB355_01490 [Patescibacteria group bacterium]